MRLFRRKRWPWNLELFYEVAVGDVRARVWKTLTLRGWEWRFSLVHLASGKESAYSTDRVPLRQLGNACVALQLLHEWDSDRMQARAAQQSPLRLVFSRGTRPVGK